jgi:hypothetical protein
VIDAAALREAACAVAEGRLRRSRALLGAVAPEERRAIESAAMGVALGLAEALLDAAARDPLVAQALAACYPAAGTAACSVNRKSRAGTAAVSSS